LFENMQNVKDSRHNTKPFIGIKLNIDWTILKGNFSLM
jgi:hypothetical protein